MRRSELVYPELPSFDDLKNLAANDPEALSALRQYYCISYINSLPGDRQHRMRCIQHRVEQEIERAANPISSIVKLSGMMHHSLGRLADGFNGKLNHDPEPRKDNVLEFPQPH